MGVSKMTKEHLGITLALKIPLFIVITKIDIAPKQVYENTLNKIKAIMSSPTIGKAPVVVKEGDDVQDFADKNILSLLLNAYYQVHNELQESLEKN